MTLILEPAPLTTDLVNSPRNLTMSEKWINWLTLKLIPGISSAAGIVLSLNVPNTSAPIGTTALIPAANAGTYRVSWRARVVTPDGAGSSFTLSVISTEGTVTITQTGAAMNGDLITTVQSGDFKVTADGGSPISFSVAYASTTPNKMVFSLQLRVESL